MSEQEKRNEELEMLEITDDENLSNVTGGSLSNAVVTKTKEISNDVKDRV